MLHCMTLRYISLNCIVIYYVILYWIVYEFNYTTLRAIVVGSIILSQKRNILIVHHTVLQYLYVILCLYCTVLCSVYACDLIVFYIVLQIQRKKLPLMLEMPPSLAFLPDILNPEALNPQTLKRKTLKPEKPYPSGAGDGVSGF